MNFLKRLDPGWVVVFLIASLAAWPFITRASLPTLTDAEMHAYRTHQILSAWQAGVPYVRWAPDFFYAFGYPVFSYYSPLTYYLGAAYASLCCGVTGAAAGVKFVLVAAIYLGAGGMYLFVRDRWGGLAGVVSVAAFSLSPYLVYIDPHARGDAPETFAIAVGIWVLWAFARLRRTVAPADAALAAVTLAALILSHNLMALVFFGLLLAWLAWDVLFGQAFMPVWILDEAPANPAGRWRVVGSLALAVGLGLALAAFMWLPAVLERDAVQFHNVAGGSYFDFRRYFVDWRELFAPALTFDLSATQMRFHYSIGLAQWILGALGLLTVFAPRLRRFSVLFFALVAVCLIYLILPGSIRVWEVIPPMAFLQFPTRLLGPAAVVLGILAGAAVSWADYLPWKHSRLALGAGAVALCGLTAMPLLYPPLWPAFGPVTAERILATELTGRGVGTTSANDFLPVGVTVPPQPQASLIESYATGPVDKINRVTLPPGTQVEIFEHGPEHDRFRVIGETEFVLRPYTFYWPGWTAYIDGVKTPTSIADPDGWMTLTVPAGTHDVLFRLENTPVRWWGWLISGAALAGLLALAMWPIRAAPLPASTGIGAGGEARAVWVTLSLTALGLLTLRFAADRLGWWRVASTGPTVVVAQHQHYAALQGDIALLAYDLPQITARPGAKIPITLYWKALAVPTMNLHVFVHFVGPDGQLWGQSDKWNPADFPITLWPLDRYVRDEHLADLRPDTPPGTYTILAGLWDPTTLQRMHLLAGADQSPEADSILLMDSFVVE